MTSADVPGTGTPAPSVPASPPEAEIEELTRISIRRRGSVDVEDATEVSIRRRPAEVGDATEVDDATEISIRRRTDAAALDADPAEDATQISTRRAAEVDDATEVSTRRRSRVDDDLDRTVVSSRMLDVEDPALDRTAPSTRARGVVGADASPAPLSEPAASLADSETDTVLARRSPPSAADTVPELEDTLLRPAAFRDSGARPQPASSGDAAPVRARDARVPDAEALRIPVPPRPMPPVMAVRAPAPPRQTAPEHPVAAPDHESVERADRVRARRRVLLVVLAAAVVAVASAGALVLLLT